MVGANTVQVMRVVTFNCQHGLASGASRAAGRRVRTDRLAAFCATFEADILALQELDVRTPRAWFADQVAAVASATGLHAVFGPASRVGWVGRFGNALLVRGGVDDVAVLRLEAGRDGPRSAILARVAVPDGPACSVAVTHLSTAQDRSGRQVAVVLDALDRRPGPHLLAGDLNRRPEQLDGLRVAGFQLADGGGPTWPARRPRYRIDHVAVRGLTITSTAVLASGPVSDHRPLRVEIAFGPT